MKVKIINKSNNPLPEYKFKYDSGMDLRAYLPDGPVNLHPMEIKVIPTGLYMETEPGYEIQVRPKSGISSKGLMAILGTVDSFNYKGEIGIIMINLSNSVQTIESGDRIAQAVCAKVCEMELEEVKELNDSERGEGGFGHTGNK